MFTAGGHNTALLLSWIQEWRTLMEADEEDVKTGELPESVKSRLFDPIRSGDPVFCTALAFELCKEENLISAIRVLTLLKPSRRRVLQCELVFYLCKCSSPENRQLSASLIPFFLWMEWLLGGSCGAEKEESWEDDVTALEIALIAIYHQDFSITPLPMATQSIPLSRASIYHDETLFDRIDHDRDVYPWNLKEERTIQSNPQFYPKQPLDKFEESNRLVLTYRLCRVILDHLPELSQYVILAFALLISRLAVAGTKLEDPHLVKQLKQGSILSTVALRTRGEPKRSSDLSLSISLLNIHGDDPSTFTDARLIEMAQIMAAAFFPPAEFMVGRKRRFPLTEPLSVQLADAMSIIKCHFPILEEHVRSHLLGRSRSLAFPAAILALSIS